MILQTNTKEKGLQDVNPVYIPLAPQYLYKAPYYGTTQPQEAPDQSPQPGFSIDTLVQQRSEILNEKFKPVHRHPVHYRDGPAAKDIRRLKGNAAVTQKVILFNRYRRALNALFDRLENEQLEKSAATGRIVKTG